MARDFGKSFAVVFPLCRLSGYLALTLAVFVKLFIH
jgi:hypothetical protein